MPRSERWKTGMIKWIPVVRKTIIWYELFISCGMLQLKRFHCKIFRLVRAVRLIWKLTQFLVILWLWVMSDKKDDEFFFSKSIQKTYYCPSNAYHKILWNFIGTWFTFLSKEWFEMKSNPNNKINSFSTIHLCKVHKCEQTEHRNAIQTL